MMVLTTSNLSGSIDDAFIDRADMKRFIGNPGVAARFAILHDCVLESEGLSGRALRKLPFQAYARWLCGRTVGLNEFLAAMKRSITVGTRSGDDGRRRRRTEGELYNRVFVRTRK